MADLSPESPPTPPVIPVGLATKLGLAFSVLASVAAALASLFEGDQTPETIALIVAALGAAYKVLDGRYNQATAAVAANPAIAAAPSFDDPEVDDFTPEPPMPDSMGEPGSEPLPPEGAVGGKPGMGAHDEATGQERG